MEPQEPPPPARPQGVVGVDAPLGLGERALRRRQAVPRQDVRELRFLTKVAADIESALADIED